ncbi:hypothetical protein EDB83DRAFT_2441637, partial [Lactarius deliciosus]
LEDPRIRDPCRDLSQRDDDGDPKDDPNDKQDGGRSSGGESESSLKLFVTTNRYHVLDPALTRPGRMDLHVEFRLASRYRARELYRRFYIPDTSEAEAASTDDDNSDDVPSDSTPTKEDLDLTPPAPKGAVPTRRPTTAVLLILGT